MSKQNQLAVVGPTDYTLEVSVTPEALAIRQGFLESAALIVHVNSPEEQAEAVELAGNLKGWAKDVEKARVELTEPLLTAQRALMSAKVKAVKEVESETKRLESLLAEYHKQQEQLRQKAIREQEERDRQAEMERLRKEREEQQRLAEIERQRAEAELAATRAKTKKAREAAAVLAAELAAQQEQEALAADFATPVAEVAVYVPPPVVVKPKGATVKEVVHFEVTDIAKFYAAHPELCEITVKTQQLNYFLATPGLDNVTIPGLRVWKDTAVQTRRQ